MGLQLLERLTDFDKEVRTYHYKTTGITQAVNLPMDKEIYYNYITLNRSDVKSYLINHSKDYIHFSY